MRIFSVVLFLLLFVSCSSEYVDTSLNMSYAENGSISIRKHDFEYEDGTRLTFRTTDKGVTCTWKDGDAIGVFPVFPESGTQARMEIHAEDVYGDAHYAVFNGDGWMLDKNNSYAAYYPINSNSASCDLYDEVEVDLDKTKQVGNKSLSHVEDMCLMYAPSTFAIENDDNGIEHCVAFDFHHVIAIMELHLIVPADAEWTRLMLTNKNSTNLFPWSAEMNVATGELKYSEFWTVPYMSLELQDVRSTSDCKELVLYMPAYPVTTGELFARLETSDGEFYDASLPSKELQAGKVYRYYADMEQKPVSGTENGYEWIDLGLGSGVKFAKVNIGAYSPDGAGKLYAWGETKAQGEVYETNLSNYKYSGTYVKTDYTWATYKFNNYSEEKEIALTKYCYDASYGYNGFVDNLFNIEMEDDAARVNMGGDWHVPSNDDFSELSSCCYWDWTDNYDNSGIAGYIIYRAKDKADRGKFSSKLINGYVVKSSPAASYSLNDAHIFIAGGQSFMTKEIYTNERIKADCRCFYVAQNEGWNLYWKQRTSPMCVRAVRF